MKIVLRCSYMNLWNYYLRTFLLPMCTQLPLKRMSASIEKIWNIVARRPKFVFSPTFIFCNPICPNNCGEVFLWKYILVFEKWFFSFDRSNMQIFTLNITRVVWPHVTNLLDLRYFCRHNPLFYHLNLIPCYYWSWQRNIYFFGEYFCPTYFFCVEK